MEELVQSFAVTLKTLLQEQQKTNQLLEKMAETNTATNLEELLTPKEVQERYNLPEGAVYKMFNDKEFPAQRYTKPMKATVTAINEYLTKRHEKVE